MSNSVERRMSLTDAQNCDVQEPDQVISDRKMSVSKTATAYRETPVPLPAECSIQSRLRSWRRHCLGRWWLVSYVKSCMRFDCRSHCRFVLHWRCRAASVNGQTERYAEQFQLYKVSQIFSGFFSLLNVQGYSWKFRRNIVKACGLLLCLIYRVAQK